MPSPVPPREDLKSAIAEYCRQEFPKEACGFIVNIHSRGVMVPCKNSADNPLIYFRIAPDEWQRAEAMGDIEMVFHSHPNARADVTPADKTCAEEIGVPFLTYGWPADAWDYYEPVGWRHELFGRPFVQGLLDCYALCRDLYDEQLGIKLPKFHYAHDFWRKSIHVIEDNMEEAGFVKVAVPRRFDGIAMRIDTGPINHLGVYMGNGMMCHHPPNRPSAKVPYDPFGRGFYPKCTDFFLRHRLMLKVKDEQLLLTGDALKQAILDANATETTPLAPS